MIKSAQTLAQWFSGFGIPAYLDSDVPDGAEPPYITITLTDPYWERKARFPVNIWYRVTSNIPPMQKADEILAAVYEGVRLYFEGGLAVLRIDPDTPTQIVVDGDYRCARVSLTLNAYHLPGV